METELAFTASLLGEPPRAAMLLKLMSGRALAAGELAVAANVSPQTASGHLAKLVEGSLLTVERQGRHRYYRLAGTQVADAVEALLTLAAGARQVRSREGTVPRIGTLAHARTCYGHLAGWLGVQIADALQRQGLLVAAGGKTFAVTGSGRVWFQDLGIASPEWGEKSAAPVGKQCLDWTERRPHLAGLPGVAMYKRFLALKWIVCHPDSRSVRVTIEGKRQLWKHLRIPIG